MNTQLLLSLSKHTISLEVTKLGKDGNDDEEFDWL